MSIVVMPKYSVMGSITLEKKWIGMLGVTIAPFDFYVWQAGGFTYSDLLAEAKRQYGEVDAVIDINVDYSGSHFLILYAQRKIIVTGIAIKYSRDEVDQTILYIEHCYNKAADCSK